MNFKILLTFSLILWYTKSVAQTDILFKNTTITTCSANLLYPGTSGDYPSNQNIVMTLTPATSGNKIDLVFSKFDIDEEGDYLYVYDGPSITSPRIAILSGQQLPDRIIASNPTGQITLKFTSDREFESTGFKIGVSCFDPLLPPTAPTGLVGYSASKRVTLKWADNSILEKGFRIQRSTNRNNSYKTIAFLAPDVTTFQDFNTSLNTIYYYKVAAYNDHAISNYTTPVQVKTGDGPISMKNETITTCSATFLDPGGFDYYSGDLNLVTTFYPGTNGKRIQAFFQDYEIYPGSSFLYVYDGPNTNSPLLFGGMADVYKKIDTVASTHPSGALTFKFTSTEGYSMPGWVATITCLNLPPAIPSNLSLTVDSINQVNLQWIDNSTNENGFIIEKSASATNEWYYPIARVATNVTSYSDANVYSNGTYFYRVRSYSAAGGKSAPSNEKVITFPIIMAGGATSVCDVAFRDPGGFGKYANNSNVTVTLMPYVDGTKLSIAFLSFDTEKNRDYLTIYDGETTSARRIGKYSGTSRPPVITATNTRGALTFVFTSNGSRNRKGWEAFINCASSIASLPSVEAQPEAGTSEALGTKVDLGKEMMVYPNPAHSSFKVQLPAKTSTINLIDSYGNKSTLERSSDETVVEFDVTSAKKGLYIIEVVNGKKITRKRVVVE